jgi:hypothetical protein
MKAALCGDRAGSSAVHDSPATFLARALATRALVSGPMRCNLRSGPLAHSSLVRRNKLQSAKTAAVFLAAGVLACCFNLIWTEMVKARKARIDRTFGTLRDTLAGYHFGAKGQAAVESVQREVAKRKELMSPFVEAFEPSLTSVVGPILETGEARDLRYDVLSLSRTKIMIGGTAGEWGSCDPLVKSLQASGYGVKLERKEALDDERIPFIIDGTGEGHGF